MTVVVLAVHAAGAAVAHAVAPVLRTEQNICYVK